MSTIYGEGFVADNMQDAPPLSIPENTDTAQASFGQPQVGADLQALTDAHLGQWIDYVTVKKDTAERQWDETGDFTFKADADTWFLKLRAAQREQVRRFQPKE